MSPARGSPLPQKKYFNHKEHIEHKEHIVFKTSRTLRTLREISSAAETAAIQWVGAVAAFPRFLEASAASDQRFT